MRWTVCTAPAILFAMLLVVPSAGSPPAQAVFPETPPYAWSVYRVATDGDTGWYSSIALDPLGNPYIAYVDGTRGTFDVVHRSNDTWVREQVDGPGTFNGNTNVAVGPDGTVHVSYYDLGGDAVKYAIRGPSGWRIVVVDSGLPDGFNRLVLDSNGEPRLVYVSYNGWVRYGTWNGTAWSLETVDDTQILPRYVDLMLDALDVPHISYYADGDLHYATKVNGAWIQEVADPSSGAGLFSRVFVDPLRAPHIAYYDSVNKTLRWATKHTGTWTQTILAGSGDSGWDLSLAADRFGRAQIAYYSRIAGALRYAVNTTDGWVLEAVDDDGVVGWYPGIATDAMGFPHISYYDWTNGDLKYATGKIGLQVRTLGIAGATTSSATVRGELVALGNHTSAEVGFAFRFVGAENWTYVPVDPAFSPGMFTTTLVNLTAGATYEFHAETRTANESAQGAVLTFGVPLPPVSSPPYLEIAASAVIVAAALAVVAVSLRLQRRRGKQRLDRKEQT